MDLHEFDIDMLISIVEQMPVSILLTDTDGIIVYTNPFTTKITKYEKSEMVGKSTSMFKSGKTPKTVYKSLWKTIHKGDVWSGDFLNKDKEGNEFWERTRVSPITGKDGTVKYFLAVKEDVTNHMVELENTKHMAHYDNLTGMMNRPFFETAIKRHIKSCKRTKKSFSLMMLDLNNFKTVNDVLGHDVGDGVLKQVATSIQGVLRGCDLSCRLGGDEFVLMIDDSQTATVENMEHLCERINDEILNIDVGDIEISASIGISKYPENGTTYEELLKRADKAMYQTKRQFKQHGALTPVHSDEHAKNNLTSLKKVV